MRQRQGWFFVNALSGLFLFLLFHTMDIFNNTDVCQRPKRAFFISTLELQNIVFPKWSCVNALNGLSSFLQERTQMAQTINWVCQRPKRAFFISTEEVVEEPSGRKKMCQRPKRAFFISTEHIGAPLQVMNGVNALNGLSSFLQ